MTLLWAYCNCCSSDLKDQLQSKSSRCSALQQDTNRNSGHRQSGSLGNAMHAVLKIGSTYVASGPRLPVATLVSQKYQSEELAILQQCTKLISEVSISGITLPSAIHRRRSQFDHSLVTLTIVRGSKNWPRQARCLISQSVFFLIFFRSTVLLAGQGAIRTGVLLYSIFIQLVCLIFGESLPIPYLWRFN